MLNGKAANIPSIRLNIGDEVSIKVKSKNIPMVIETIKNPALTRPEWMSWDEAAQVVKVAHLPAIEDVPFPVDVQQVVEYYANRV